MWRLTGRAKELEEMTDLFQGEILRLGLEGKIEKARRRLEMRKRRAIGAGERDGAEDVVNQESVRRARRKVRKAKRRLRDSMEAGKLEGTENGKKDEGFVKAKKDERFIPAKKDKRRMDAEWVAGS